MRPNATARGLAIAGALALGIDGDVQTGQTITVEVTLPDSGWVPFVCKYHVANGMQGAFVIG